MSEAKITTLTKLSICKPRWTGGMGWDGRFCVSFQFDNTELGHIWVCRIRFGKLGSNVSLESLALVTHFLFPPGANYKKRSSCRRCLCASDEPDSFTKVFPFGSNGIVFKGAFEIETDVGYHGKEIAKKVPSSMAHEIVLF